MKRAEQKKITRTRKKQRRAATTADTPTPANSADKAENKKELIHIYQELKRKYRNYDTREALKLIQGFRKALRNLEERGFLIGLELLGSLNFGIAERNSDADLVLIHYCDLHRKSGECLPNCPNLIFERKTIADVLRQSLDVDTFHIETLDCINLHYISDKLVARADSENSIANNIEDSILLRFLFYFTIGRPVHRTLFANYYDKLTRHTKLMRYFANWASQSLAMYLQTSDHRYSFHKYNERILSHGLQLPAGLRAELEKYLA